jgi:hypothetical protein
MSATQTQTHVKKAGDISDSFVSLSGASRPALPQRFLDLKQGLVQGHEDAVIDSWKRLLRQLKIEVETVAKEGSNVIPTIEFGRLDSDVGRLRGELKKRGVAVVRGVIPEEEARGYKSEVDEYVKLNPSTKCSWQLCGCAAYARKFRIR